MEDSLVTGGVDPHRIELLQLVAHADDHVRLVEPEVDVVVAHEPHRAKRMGVVVGEHALAVKGGGNREAQLLGEASERAGGARPGCSVPGQDDGPAAAVEHRRGAPDLRRRRLVGPWDVELEWGEIVWRGHSLDVLGHGQVDGAGAFGLGQLEGLSDHFGDCSRGEHQVRPLGHRGEHRHQVDALVGLLVDAIQPHLGRESHHRRAVGGGVGRPEEEIDGAWAEGRRAHTGAPGDAAEDLGHERRRLLVANQHVPNGGAGQSVGEVDVLLARDAEHAGDALVLEAAHEQVGDTAVARSHASECNE